MRMVRQDFAGLDVRRAICEKHHPRPQLGQSEGFRDNSRLYCLTRHVFDDGLAAVLPTRPTNFMELWMK